jgi:hypothetical protein
MENNKAAEAISNPAGGATTGQTVNGSGGANPDPSIIPNPKLGMAPLSSEIAVAAASNHIPGKSQQPSNLPPPDPLQPTDLQSTRTLVLPTIDLLRPDPAAIGPTKNPAIPVPSEPEQVSQENDPPPSLPDSTTLPPDPTLTVDPAEEAHPPNPNLTPSHPLTADPPDIGSHPPLANNSPEEKN